VKRTTLLLAMLLCALVAQGFAQKKLPTLKAYTAVKPAPKFDMNEALTAPAVGLQTWNRTVNATKDGGSYNIVMVGQDPATSTVTTNIPTVIIPVIVKIGTISFNPNAIDNTCMVAPNNVPKKVFRQSPLFANHAFTMNGVNVGTTQYLDAYQRANFKSQVAATYHTKLATISVKAAQTFNVPIGSGSVFSTAGFGNGGCGPSHNPAGNFGIVDVNAMDNWVLTTALPKALVTPNQFPILLLYNVVMSVGPPTIANCCILGYHGATAGPPNGQTYSPMEFDTSGIFGNAISDVSIGAHEIGEWMEDPYGNNPTPAWGGIGQVGGCQGNLENGDPLTGTNFPPVTMANGFTYHLQELAFLSWYYNAQTDPSIGAGGKFSNNGTFKGPAKVCPPGGTF